MAQSELDELRQYWSDKYPNVEVCFYPEASDNKYRGRMSAYNKSLDLEASTIGELISQGESFLRAHKT